MYALCVQKNTYTQVLESALMMSGIQIEIPFLWLCKYLPLPSIQTLFRADEYLLGYGTRAIANAKGQEGHTSNVFSTILAESQKDGSTLSSMDVNREAGNFIVAGSDTSAVTLTYLIWAVLKQPPLQRALEAEVCNLKPGFVDADLETLPLLNSVIEEALRLYGAAPASLPRTVPPDGGTLGGYFIPGGTTVNTQAYTIHRDSSLFPNPETYVISPSKPPNSLILTKDIDSTLLASSIKRNSQQMLLQRSTRSALAQESVLVFTWHVWNFGLQHPCFSENALVRNWLRAVRTKVWRWRTTSLSRPKLIVVRSLWKHRFPKHWGLHERYGARISERVEWPVTIHHVGDNDGRNSAEHSVGDSGACNGYQRHQMITNSITPKNKADGSKYKWCN